MQRGNLIISFLLGLGVGAAAALLFAPASGLETRRRLGEMADRTSDGANELLARGRTLFSQGSDAGRQAVDNLQEKARGAAHQAGRDMEERGRQLQSV